VWSEVNETKQATNMTAQKNAVMGEGDAPRKGEVIHQLTRCINIGQWHYSFRNHSAAFECAAEGCGRRERRNTNFLGNRFHLECDGKKFYRIANAQRGST